MARLTVQGSGLAALLGSSMTGANPLALNRADNGEAGQHRTAAHATISTASAPCSRAGMFHGEKDVSEVGQAIPADGLGKRS